MQTVAVQVPGGGREIDIKKYAKVEKLPGGSIEDCKVLAGVPLVTKRSLHLILEAETTPVNLLQV